MRKSQLSIITKQDPSSNITESFRTIRTSLKYAALDKLKTIIMFTSAIASEGKTTIVSNLGVLTAQDDKKVLLIDGDLRRPHLHHIFACSNRVGLSTFLSGFASIEDSISRTEIPQLYVMPAGPIHQQPAEMLGSIKMEQLLLQCKEQFDVVLIDTPPLMHVTDPTLIARISDGIVIVSRSMISKKDQVRRAQAILEPFKDKIIGYILNDRK